MPKFEDEFDELVKNLAFIFKQKQSLVPSTMLQRKCHEVLRPDRYIVLSHKNKPRFAVVDIRYMEKVRKALVSMGYINDRMIFDDEIAEPQKRPDAVPDKLTFNLGDGDEQ